MKTTSAIAPAILACLMSVALTNAGPISTSSRSLSSRSAVDAAIVDAQYIRDIEAEIIARAAELQLEARGSGLSKLFKDKKDTKASYPVGNNRPETPKGEFRQFTAGRHDDYFGCLSFNDFLHYYPDSLFVLDSDWQTMTGGRGKSAVHNPAAGKRRGRKRDLSELNELEMRDSYEAELEARDFFEADLEAREFLDVLD
ncbi:hypothetical protein DXG03_004987 [Asterophora parasitica]|uniref:Uncharacterized protein n=1 Tax=Asterophora parasitica TaxID=117018 RepID=A0A9P7GE68_9AGAR|nr:hypothetical protein DXG03_004987 [Asterophora parasitica]